MNANLDKIALDLYGKIQTRFPNIKIGDAEAGVLSKKTDIPNARFFEFEYKDEGEVLGTIAITLDEDDGIVVQVGGEIADTKHPGAYKFIRSFRQFAKDRLLNFDVQNIGKNNLDKRDYTFQAKRKEEPAMEPMMENRLYGTSRMSYQDLGEAKLIVKHSQAINQDLPAGRTMHIEGIWVENAEGERFRYPYKHLNGARALAEHIKAGGNPYDAIGKHITSLSEELAQLRKFKGYVSRNDTLAEAMGDITTKVMERIELVKKEIRNLQRPAYYEQFAESFEDHEEQMIPEEIMSDWIDRLTIRTFNEELKTAFPYIFRLVDGSNIPVREIGPEDLMAEEHGPKKVDVPAVQRKKSGATDWNVTHADLEKDKERTATTPQGLAKRKKDLGIEESQFESFMDSLMVEDEDTQTGENELFSADLAKRSAALEKLKGLLAGGMTPGVNGSNALSLKGIIDSPLFLEKLDALSDEDSMGTAVKLYLDDLRAGVSDPSLTEPEMGDPKEIATEIIATKALASDTDQPPVGGVDMPATPATPGPEAALAAAPAVPPAVPPASDTALAAAPAVPPAPPLAENAGRMQKLKQKFIQAKECGAGLNHTMDFGHSKMSMRDAILKSGLSLAECGWGSEQEYHHDEDPVHSILKSISGFWSPQEKNFTLGGTRTKIKVIKGFKDGEYPNASPEHVKQVIAMIEKMDPSSDHNQQHDRMRQLAGVAHAPDQQASPADGMKHLLQLLGR